MRNIEQQPNGPTTHALKAEIYLTILKKSCIALAITQNVRTNVRELHCNNLDRIRSHPNEVFP